MAKSNSVVVSFPAIRASKTDLLILWSLAVMGSSEAVDLFIRGVTTIVRKWTWKSDDATQITLVRIWTELSKYDPSKASLSTWLRQQCRAGWLYANRANPVEKQFPRSKGGRKEVEEDFDCAVQAAIEGTVGNEMDLSEMFPDRCCSVDNQEAIENLLFIVGERDMEVLSWYFIDGNTFKQIAEKLEVSIPTARSRVLAIVNAIRSKYGVTDKVVGLNRKAGAKIEMATN